jgi:hypothetical protein
MRLRDLEPAFLAYNTVVEGAEKRVFHKQVHEFNEAQGIEFLCPCCYEANKGNVGTHLVIVWFKDKVPVDAEPGPGRWTPSGNSFDNLTLAPSIQLRGGCNWHGFVQNGLTVDA